MAKRDLQPTPTAPRLLPPFDLRELLRSASSFLASFVRKNYPAVVIHLAAHGCVPWFGECWISA